MTTAPALLISLILLSAILLWPRHGLVAWGQRRRQQRQIRRVEDALKHIHRQNEHGQLATAESLAGALYLRPEEVIRLIEHMQRDQLIGQAGNGYRLTPDGNACALHIIRAHRLWERYLADQAGWPLASLHTEADRREHATTDTELDALDAALGHPQFDPHGDPIPSVAGDVSERELPSLDRWPIGTPGCIAHVEDEPTEVFAQIAALGLKPGVPVRVLEATPARVVFEAGQTQHILAPVVAANIFVEAAAERERHETALSTLRRGQHAIIAALRDDCQGLTRRRFLDLGLTPGTPIEAALNSPLRDPVAYRVRGTLIALRHEQADKILIDPGSIEQGASA